MPWITTISLLRPSRQSPASFVSGGRTWRIKAMRAPDDELLELDLRRASDQARHGRQVTVLKLNACLDFSRGGRLFSQTETLTPLAAVSRFGQHLRMVSSSGRAVSPYRGLPPRQYWKTGVREAIAPPDDFYRKKFPIDSSMQIMTAGSCFAQHIATHLRKRGYSVIDEEPAPAHLRDRTAKQFGYRTYSARYGNIYTARQLLQLLREASGRFDPQDIIWERAGASSMPCDQASSPTDLNHRRR